MSIFTTSARKAIIEANQLKMGRLTRRGMPAKWERLEL
jgi:hypothetical protein